MGWVKHTCCRACDTRNGICVPGGPMTGNDFMAEPFADNRKRRTEEQSLYKRGEPVLGYRGCERLPTTR